MPTLIISKNLINNSSQKIKIGTLERTCVFWHMLFRMTEVTSWALEWSQFIKISNIPFSKSGIWGTPDYFHNHDWNIRTPLISIKNSDLTFGYLKRKKKLANVRSELPNYWLVSVTNLHELSKHGTMRFELVIFNKNLFGHAYHQWCKKRINVKMRCSS